MPSIFPNTFYTTKEEKQQVVERVNEKGREVGLYHEFKKFYQIEPIDYLIFITGRQKDCFGSLTRYHLKNIIYQYIYYFPRNLDHKGNYLNWKLETTKKVIQRYFEIVGDFYIIDDVSLYFEDLRKWVNDYILEQELESLEVDYHNFYYIPIDEPSDWFCLKEIAEVEIHEK